MFSTFIWIQTSQAWHVIICNKTPTVFSSLLGSLCAQSGKCRGQRDRAGGAATGAWRPPPGLLSGCAQFPSQDAMVHHTRGNCSFSWDSLSSISVSVLLIIDQWIYYTIIWNIFSHVYILMWICVLKDMVKREDLRHLTVCSVDPPGCTDIDDALHCRELDNGNLEVHILYTCITK